ncbi:MAG: zinc-binding dehydrogenase [Halobacteriaceae archaeon]
MTQNDAIVFEGEGRVTHERRPTPEPDDGEVLIRTERSLVSTGTELTMLSGEFPEDSHWDHITDYPFVPGYCNVGRVADVGDDVSEDRVGDRVATHAPHARYVTAAADDPVAVPDGVSNDAAPLFALAAIVANGVRRSRLDFGEAAAVYGCGLLGQLATRFCRFAGAGTVLAVDLADERLAYLPDAPDVAAVDPTRTDPTDRLEATDGRLADVVFEVTGNPAAITDEVEALREQGRLVVLSSPRGETSFDFHDHCNWPSYEIIGAHASSHPPRETPANQWTRARNAALFFRLVDEGRFDVDGLVDRVEPPAAAPAVYDDLLDDRTRFMAVEFDWE